MGAVAGPQADLDQFVVPERVLDLGKYGTGQPLVTDDDYRLQRVAETPEVLELEFFEHGGAL